MVGVVQLIGNGMLVDGVVVDVVDKIDDVDLLGGDILMVIVDVVGFNGFMVIVNGIEIIIFLNLLFYVLLVKGEMVEEIFIYIVIDVLGV